VFLTPRRGHESHANLETAVTTIYTLYEATPTRARAGATRPGAPRPLLSEELFRARAGAFLRQHLNYVGHDSHCRCRRLHPAEIADSR